MNRSANSFSTPLIVAAKYHWRIPRVTLSDSEPVNRFRHPTEVILISTRCKAQMQRSRVNLSEQNLTHQARPCYKWVEKRCMNSTILAAVLCNSVQIPRGYLIASALLP